MTCSRCGSRFSAPAKATGRPRSRCDECRTNHDRIGGTRWLKLRAEVLREEPVCAVAGCGEPSSQVDHRTPLAKAPELAFVRSNLRGLCAHCNASKGDRDETAEYCAHPLCRHPEDCPGPNARWHL